MPAKPLPSAAYLRECFRYNPKTGELRWKTRPREHFVSDHAQIAWNAKHRGKEAGYNLAGKNGSRRYVTLCYALYYAHRIIYKIMTGEEPTETIDHRLGNALDNRWKVLREATPGQQVWNRGLKSNNTSGLRGAFQTKNGERWYSKIAFKGRVYYLGNFATAEEANAAFEMAARKFHGEFYRKIV